jgi:Putative MetA-pathway of phenol degradation
MEKAMGIEAMPLYNSACALRRRPFPNIRAFEDPYGSLEGNRLEPSSASSPRTSASNMQSGQALHVNYATSYEVLKNVRLAFNGYWRQQLTDDRINNSMVPYSKERTVGLGPGLQLGGHDIWFRSGHE